jgi:energy-coupling factor transporter ATP-binding protein EcfA2
LNNICLDLTEGKAILLRGENGSGKSTMAKVVAGILKPSSGKVIYSIYSEPVDKKFSLYQHLAYLQQSTMQNIIGVNPFKDLELWILSSVPNQDERNNRIMDVLSAWDLYAKRNLPVWELSAGELKCLALAGLTACESKYWVLDEPLSGLDEKHIDYLLQIIKHKQSTSPGMLIISHQLDSWTDIVDETYYLNAGTGIVKE